MQQQEERRAEVRRRQQEEQARRLEVSSASAVRKVILRIKMAKPETLDTLREELEKTMGDQLVNMGSLASKVREEAEKELLAAQQRVDETLAKKAEEEAKKAEEEAKLRAEMDRADRLLQAATVLLAEAEAKISTASSAKEALQQAGKEAKPDAVSRAQAMQALSDTVQAAHDAMAKASKALLPNWSELAFPVKVVGKLKTDFRALQPKVLELRKLLLPLLTFTRDSKEREERRAAAERRRDRQAQEFNRFDVRGAGHLGKEDVVAFAREVYQLELGGDELEQIYGKLSVDPAGVPKPAFQRLRQLVAIARSVRRARAKAAEDRRLREQVEVKLREIEAMFAEAEAVLAEAEAAAKEGEADVRPLLARGSARLPPAQMRVVAGKVEAAAASGRAVIDRARGAAAAAGAAAASEGGAAVRAEMEQLSEAARQRFEGRAKKAQVRLDKCAAVARAAHQRLVRAEHAERGEQRAKIVAAVGTYLEAKEMAFEQLHAHIARSSGGELRLQSWLAFAEELQEHLADKLDRSELQACEELFQRAAAGAEALSQEALSDMLTLVYAVGKSTMLTVSASIQSKSVRRLEQAELVVALPGPRRDEEAGVTRARCRAIQDGAEGWATIAGNKGTVFLEPLGVFHACVRETVVTKDLDAGSESIRKLHKDDIVELLGVPQQDTACGGLVRTRAKVVGTDVVGWVSLASSAGTKFIEPC